MVCLSVVVCGALAGCSVQPYKVERGVAEKTTEVVYKCAVGQANKLGYALSQADKSTGFFKADRAFSPGFGFGWGDKLRYELAVLITEQAGGGGTKINATASRFKDGKQENATKDLEGEVDTIIRACS